MQEPVIEGTILEIFDKQQKTDNLSIQEFVLNTKETTNYPQPLLIQCKNTKCDELNKFNVGDRVRVSLNLDGRKWDGPQGVKYFNTLSAWKFERV